MKTNKKASLGQNKSTAVPKRQPQSATTAAKTEYDLFWKDGIAALQAREFETIEVAIDAIMQEVGKKTGGCDAEQLEFMRTVFLTDPMLIEQLRKLLKIRSH
jgi:hypothetical protein